MTELRRECEQMWSDYFYMVDSWVSCGNYTTLQTRLAACVQKEWDLWNYLKQENCTHPNLTALRIDLDDDLTTCDICGKRLQERYGT